MVSANQFRVLVSDYLRGAVALDDFSNRFAEMFDDVEDDGNVDAVKLSYQIESALADLSVGIISESTLREVLTMFVSNVSVEVNSEFSVSPQHKFKKKDEPLSGHVELDLEYV
jgi:hypothetical protein